MPESFFVGFRRRRRFTDEMTESDLDLLKKYLREGCEPAFAEVVRRNVDLVFSVAIRKVRSQQLAEEITQSAFLDLSRNISRLQPDTIVSAWLYQVTHRTAVDVIRQETRREAREQIAFKMSALDSSPDPAQPDWKQIEPVLDDEMAELQETDRIAILLRFFKGKSFSEVGRAIGASDDAAQKRVSRALEKLRAGLQRRGVTSGAAGLVTIISTQAVQAAPVGLASSVVGTVVSATIASGGIAVAAAHAVTINTVQKVAFALVAAGAIGTAAYQTQKCHRLERDLAETRQRAEVKIDTEAGSATSSAGAVPPPVGAEKSQDNFLNEALSRLHSERARLIAQRDAAERLARLYKEVATSREAADVTDQFPTARHVTAAMGRLMRKCVLMQEALKGKNQEELSPEEQEVMKSGGVAMMAEVTTLAEAELQLSRQEQQPKDPVDDLTVFAYGALDLDEQQFHQVYKLLRELEREAAGFSTSVGFSTEKRDALKAVAEEKLTALLGPEQRRLFQLLKSFLPLVRFQQAK